MSDWISVVDRLPDKDGIYLTLNIVGMGANVTYTYDWKTGGEPFGYMIRKYYCNKRLFTSKFGHSYVTHWQPLPELPK